MLSESESEATEARHFEGTRFDVIRCESADQPFDSVLLRANPTEDLDIKELHLRHDQARELARVLQGPLPAGTSIPLEKDTDEDAATVYAGESGVVALNTGVTTLDLGDIIDRLVNTLIEWDIGFQRPTDANGSVLTHDERVECIDDEAFLGDVKCEISRGHGDDGGDVTVYCPACGRTYDYVYKLIGLWDKQKDEYVWEK